jgi:hypothetical protein
MAQLRPCKAIASATFVRGIWAFDMERVRRGRVVLGLGSVLELYLEDLDEDDDRDEWVLDG